MIVPGGGLSPDGDSWIACRKGFFLPVRVLSKLFRRLMLEKLEVAHATGLLNFYGNYANLADTHAFKRFLRPCRRRKWFVYAKRPFAGPKTVLAYLSRYTHRVAISNRRLIRVDANGVMFRVKDYRRNGSDRYTTMTLAPHEFIRRFLIHVLPKGLHRIRHYGLFASGVKANNLNRMRELLGVAAPEVGAPAEGDDKLQPGADAQPCPSCGSTMRIIEVFDAGCTPRHAVTPTHLVAPAGIDSS